MPTMLPDGATRRPHRPNSLPPTRTTLAGKLALLGQGASPRATQERLEEFRRLFAYRHSGSVVTRVGQGPRAWTRLPNRLGTNQIVRHLLGDRLPGREPIWFGARAFSHSRWFCIDVDADRAPRQLLADRYDLTHADEEMKAHLANAVRRTQKPRPTFTTRLTLVERALRRLGLDPSDQRQVLSLTTPSGGRHLYVFLDDSYHLEIIFDLLASAGLKHTPGEVELFPAVNRALRLPFGHLPDHFHNPDAWVQFIDDYRNGRIRRFSLATLRSNLDRHVDRWQRQARSVCAARRSSPTPPAAPAPILGVPKSQRVKPAPSRPNFATGIRTFAEAEALLANDIEDEGTRTQILKHLAAHLIWFRHMSADEAATTLATWAMSPRHRSKDIAADLSKGTKTVAQQIRSMCRWYAARKRTTRASGSSTQFARFSRTELDALRTCLCGLEPEERHNQAEFLLHFLIFAKQHGTVADNGSGRDSSPAVIAVIKKWPGCSHMQYKVRVDHAVAAGVLTLVKEKWQNPNGPGRARTYRLHVPVVPSVDESLDRAAALAYLTTDVGLDGLLVEKKPVPGYEVIPAEEENDADYDRSASTAQGHPPALPEEGPDRGLGEGSRQRDPQRDAAHRLPGRHPHFSRACSATSGHGSTSICRFARAPIAPARRLIAQGAEYTRPQTCSATVPNFVAGFPTPTRSTLQCEANDRGRSPVRIPHHSETSEVRCPNILKRNRVTPLSGAIEMQSEQEPQTLLYRVGEHVKEAADLLAGEDRGLIPAELRIDLQERVNSLMARRARLLGGQGWDLLDPPPDVAVSGEQSLAAWLEVCRGLDDLALGEDDERRVRRGDCQSYEESLWHEAFRSHLEQLGDLELEYISSWQIGRHIKRAVKAAKQAIRQRTDEWWAWRDSFEAGAIADTIRDEYAKMLRRDPDVGTLNSLLDADTTGQVLDGLLEDLWRYVVPERPEQPFVVRAADMVSEHEGFPPEVIAQCAQTISNIAYRHTECLRRNRPQLLGSIPAPTRAKLGGFLRGPLCDALFSVWSSAK